MTSNDDLIKFILDFYFYTKNWSTFRFNIIIIL